MLDERDREFIEVLRSLNVPRAEAVLVTYLANVSEATSREIEMSTGLRQPEVSIGMQTLNKNKWVTVREDKTEEKGRTKNVYSLSVPIEEIIKYYEDEKNRESVLAMEAIQKLKKMATIEQGLRAEGY